MSGKFGEQEELVVVAVKEEAFVILFFFILGITQVFYAMGRETLQFLVTSSLTLDNS